MKGRFSGFLILLAISLLWNPLSNLFADKSTFLPQTGRERAQTIDKGKLRDITGIEHTPVQPSGFPRWLFGLGIVIFIFTILGMTCWKLTRRIWKQTGLTLDQWINKELDDIETLDLPAKGKGDEFHNRLEKTVRQYLEIQFQISASTQTTGELLSTIESSSFLSPAHQEILQELLHTCEQAKFAKAKFSLQECQELLSRARVFVKLRQPFPSIDLTKK